MAFRLNPYLNFNGNAREAMEFYALVFGGSLTFTTFADFDPDSPDRDLIMHAMLETDSGLTIMACDVPGHMEYQAPAGFAISLSGDDAAALRAYWEKLSADGKTTMPLEKQAWGDEFGMCADKYGVEWMVDIGQS
jgi:PhnB protein